MDISANEWANTYRRIHRSTHTLTLSGHAVNTNEEKLLLHRTQSSQFHIHTASTQMDMIFVSWCHWASNVNCLPSFIMLNIWEDNECPRNDFSTSSSSPLRWWLAVMLLTYIYFGVWLPNFSSSSFVQVAILSRNKMSLDTANPSVPQASSWLIWPLSTNKTNQPNAHPIKAHKNDHRETIFCVDLNFCWQSF